MSAAILTLAILAFGVLAVIAIALWPSRGADGPSEVTP